MKDRSGAFFASVFHQKGDLMGRYLLRRFLLIIPVLLVLTLIIFSITEMIPGDAAQTMLGEHVTGEALRQLRSSMGLDQPWYTRYLAFVGRVATGDLGRSLMSGMSVGEEIKEKLAATMELAIFALLLAVIVGILAGFLAAWKKNSVFDYLSTIGSLVGVSMPIYWLGFLMILLFSVKLGWLPTSGRISATLQLTPVTGFYIIDTIIAGDWKGLQDVLSHMIMPAICLATGPMAMLTRMTRSSMLEALNQDYIRTAKAKGVSTKKILFVHAFKNASIPVITVLGLQFGYLMGGAILTETVFSWPGIGNWVLQGIMARDFPVILGGTLVVSSLFIFVNLLVDVLYAFLDPRIRY